MGSRLVACVMAAVAVAQAWGAGDPTERVINGVTVFGTTKIAPVVPAFEIKDVAWGTGKVLESGQPCLVVSGLLVPKGKWCATEVEITFDVHFLAAGGVNFRKLVAKVTMPDNARATRFTAIDKMLDNPPERFCYTVRMECHRATEVPWRGPAKGASNPNPRGTSAPH